ncbi:hypothetical protein ACFSR7_16350 [Cohnella sp. GCM10020058]|uniref:hypothetical protein n=1 Tax=Cohnella sp. GCM10020058 TaxID=3317330 RepID=UPI0036444ACA
MATGMEMSTMAGNEKLAKAGSRPIGRTAAYWIVTVILAFSIALSGMGQLMRYGGNVDLVTALAIASWALRPQSRKL